MIPIGITNGDAGGSCKGVQIKMPNQNTQIECVPNKKPINNKSKVFLSAKKVAHKPVRTKTN